MSFVSEAQAGDHEKAMIPTNQNFTLSQDNLFEDLYDKDYHSYRSGGAELIRVSSSGHAQRKTSGLISEEETEYGNQE